MTLVLDEVSYISNHGSLKTHGSLVEELSTYFNVTNCYDLIDPPNDYDLLDPPDGTGGMSQPGPPDLPLPSNQPSSGGKDQKSFTTTKSVESFFLVKKRKSGHICVNEPEVTNSNEENGQMSGDNHVIRGKKDRSPFALGLHVSGPNAIFPRDLESKDTADPGRTQAIADQGLQATTTTITITPGSFRTLQTHPTADQGKSLQDSESFHDDNSSNNESVAKDTLNLVKRYLPSDLFKTLNGLFEKSDGLVDQDPCLQNPYSPNPNTHDPNTTSRFSPSHTVALNPLSHLHHYHQHNHHPSNFHAHKIDLHFREELQNDKIIPLSNVIFNKYDPQTFTTKPKPMDFEDNIYNKPLHRCSTITHLKRQTIKNMLNVWQWRRPKWVSDSAELENQIFSPGTHRPNTLDVPSIHQVELENEDTEIRISSGSIINGSFEMNPIDMESDQEDDVNEEKPESGSLSDIIPPPKPILKESRIIRGYRKIKNNSLRVRFLSPLHSPRSPLVS